MTQRWKLTIEYDGAGFSGWQRQINGASVQQTIEEAIYAFSGEEVRLQVAGRTDAGVHALAQVAHFDLEKESTAHTVQSALNFHKHNEHVTILQAMPVDDDFHARFNAQARSYTYHLCNRSAPLALTRGKAWHYPKKLELEPMQEAAKCLIGTHDFTTFRAKFCQANSAIRSIDLLEVSQEGDMFFFDLQAKSFLYHQVRNIVGSLVRVGTGKWTPADFKDALEACERKKGGQTAPASGLYFICVDYPA